MNTFSISELRRLIGYDPHTGRLEWLERMSQNVKPSMAALAAKKSSGHCHGFVKGVPLQAHRVAWALHYGEWPEGFIDHINGIRDDNRISNLRVVCARDNAKNRRPNKGKASRLPHGVSKKGNGKFFAQIQEGNINHHLGYFETPDEASGAYTKARELLGFHKNHGLEALIAQEPDT